jgi:hypothetical protein
MNALSSLKPTICPVALIPIAQLVSPGMGKKEDFPPRYTNDFVPAGMEHPTTEPLALIPVTFNEPSGTLTGSGVERPEVASYITAFLPQLGLPDVLYQPIVSVARR